jgi:hypothetical protein
MPSEITHELDSAQSILAVFSGDSCLSIGSHLHAILTDPSSFAGVTAAPITVIGIKWLPRVELLQAKELVPDAASPQYRSNIDSLTRHPLFLVVLRGVSVLDVMQRYTRKFPV